MLTLETGAADTGQSTACSQGLTTLLNGLSFLPLHNTILMPLPWEQRAHIPRPQLELSFHVPALLQYMLLEGSQVYQHHGL